jgi:hypothetical protein
LLGGSAAVIEVAAGQSTLASALKLLKKVSVQVMPQNSGNSPNVTVYDRLIYKKETCELTHPVCKQTDDTVDEVVLNSY